MGLSVDTYVPGGSTRRGLVSRTWGAVSVQLRFVVNVRRYDILYARWHPLTVGAVAMAHAVRLPTILELNGTDEDPFLAWGAARRLRTLIQLLGRRQLRWATGLVTVTPGLRDWAVGVSPEARVRVVPNAADPRQFSPGSPTGGFPDHVVFQGSLAPWQGIETMLDASRLDEWPPEVELWIVGDGALRLLCESRSTTDGRVQYLGPRTKGEIERILRGALAAISIQTGEGLRDRIGVSPLKVYEGMACGRPIVVSDLPIQADLIREERCGLVVPSGDTVALANAVRRLYSHPVEREEMGKRSRQALVARHSWVHRARDVFAFIEDCTSLPVTRDGEQL
jgi:glycosyltransferase involved in cell wall biosynthesis